MTNFIIGFAACILILIGAVGCQVSGSKETAKEPGAGVAFFGGLLFILLGLALAVVTF